MKPLIKNQPQHVQQIEWRFLRLLVLRKKRVSVMSAIKRIYLPGKSTVRRKRNFLELDTDVLSDVKKCDMCQSDHNYGSFASPVDMAHINSARTKQELFCKKNHQDQCYSADDIFKNRILLSEVQKLILLETEVVRQVMLSQHSTWSICPENITTLILLKIRGYFA